MLHWAPCPVHAQAQHAGSDGTCRRHRSGDAVRGGQPAIYFLGTGIHRLLPYVQTRLRGQGENAGRRAEGYGLRHTPKSAVVRWVVYASRRNKEGTCDTHPCTSALGDDLTLAGSPSQRQSCSAPQDRRSRAAADNVCMHLMAVSRQTLLFWSLSNPGLHLKAPQRPFLPSHPHSLHT